MLGPLMVDIEGLELSADDREVLAHPSIGGVILFARNYAEPAQLACLVQAIHELRSPPLLVAVDQEGGRVQRFRGDFFELPELSALGECYDADPAEALACTADHAWMMAAELRAVGIDFSFAPVLDLRTAHSAVIGERALHADPEVVARLGRAYIAALHATGMAAVAKHFPGHGCVAADSHHELPIDERDFQDIERTDLRPFRAAVDAGVEGMMTAHVLFPRVDDVAAGYSRTWIGEVLRSDMQFQGVVFSDDLSMAGAALPGTRAERAERALAAGCDVLLVCNDRPAVLEIVDALGAARYPQTQVRLMRMHGRGSPTDLAELHRDARWRGASERLARLTRFPELDLGDDNLLV